MSAGVIYTAAIRQPWSWNCADRSRCRHRARRTPYPPPLLRFLPALGRLSCHQPRRLGIRRHGVHVRSQSDYGTFVAFPAAISPVVCAILLVDILWTMLQDHRSSRSHGVRVASQQIRFLENVPRHPHQILGPPIPHPPTRLGSPSGLIAAPLVPLGRVQQTKTTHSLAYSPKAKHPPTLRSREVHLPESDLHKDSRAKLSLFATSLLLSISHQTLVCDSSKISSAGMQDLASPKATDRPVGAGNRVQGQ